MLFETFTITFEDRILTAVGIDTRNFLAELEQILFDKFNFIPVYPWYTKEFQKTSGIYLQSITLDHEEDRFYVHVDKKEKTVKIYGDTENCVAWGKLEWLSIESRENPKAIYEDLLEILEEDNGLSAIVPFWSTKKVYENNQYEVLVDTSGYTYLLEKRG